MPALTTTGVALVPAAAINRVIQPSRPIPLMNTAFAAPSVLASEGVGENTCASLFGPIKVVTSTRSPPTLFTRSPMIEIDATTLSLSSAQAGAATNIAASTNNTDLRIIG